MNSMPNPEVALDDVAVAALKRVRQVCKLEPDFFSHPVKLLKHPPVPPHRSLLVKLALQGVIALLVAVGIGTAAMVLGSQGETDKQVTAGSELQLSLISS